jgi:hypothetical protein
LIRSNNPKLFNSHRQLESILEPLYTSVAFLILRATDQQI